MVYICGLFNFNRCHEVGPTRKSTSYVRLIAVVRSTMRPTRIASVRVLCVCIDNGRNHHGTLFRRERRRRGFFLIFYITRGQWKLLINISWRFKSEKRRLSNVLFIGMSICQTPYNP